MRQTIKQIMFTNYTPVWIILILLAFTAVETKAQISAPAFPADSSYVNAISISSDYGLNLNRKADYLSFTTAYSRKIKNIWVLSGGVAFDNEMEVVDDKNQYTSAFSGVGKVSYYLTKRWTLSTGLIKEFASNGNENKSMKTTSGDWSTGLTIGADIPELAFWEHDIYGLSISYLYNITKSESTIALGIIIGGGW